jgi:hypothetical protein
LLHSKKLPTGLNTHIAEFLYLHKVIQIVGNQKAIHAADTARSQHISHNPLLFVWMKLRRVTLTLGFKPVKKRMKHAAT